MEAETLNCPMCGASAATDATRCEHCGARLATVACPSCFGLIFQGARFCSHCGARVDRTEVSAEAQRLCPHCRVNLEAVVVGTTNLLECSKCEGIWADTATFQEICTDREKQAAVLGMAGPLPDTGTGDVRNFRYVPCPVCKTLMNRINFANCSHVVIDVCAKHGSWFDRDELRKVVEFIRDGGLEKSRAREIDELERQRMLLRNDQMMRGASVGGLTDSGPRYDGYETAMRVLGSALRGILKL